jgi:hypothetical protein
VERKIRRKREAAARRIIRKAEVRRRTGYSDTTIWRLERDDLFPRRVQPGLHRGSDREANGLRFNGEAASPRARQLTKTRTTTRHRLRPGNEATSWAKGMPPGPISALPRGNYD